MQKPENQTSSTDMEILEELDEVAQSPEGASYSEYIRPVADAAARTGVDLFTNPNLPFLILDQDLAIVYFTPRAEILFKGYYTLALKPFFNIFNQTLAIDDLKDLVISLKSYEKGFSWTGTLKHKTPTTKTLHTRTTIVPFFTMDHSVAGFQVFFEDITSSYFDQLQTTFKSILEAAKLKDNDTGMHDERVSYYSKRMTEYLYTIQKYPQIDPDFIENIGFLAAMHDVGKIGTPDYILQKPGKLTEQEWEIMREHTINGTFILSSYPVVMAKEIALSHHEWWNGGGYPFKLEGEMIPLSARIVTIADVYDALRMKRTYKSEFTHEEAMQKIIAGSGTQFDPDLVESFVRINPDFEDIWNLLKDNSQSGIPESRDRSKEFTESL
jgi:HD-GYP domain-containing protein (c-di-GMP phosphodiesterase class II)